MACAALMVSFLAMPYAFCVPCAMVCPALLNVSPRLLKKLFASAFVVTNIVANKLATRKVCQSIDLMLCFPIPLQTWHISQPSGKTGRKGFVIGGMRRGG